MSTASLEEKIMLGEQTLQSLMCNRPSVVQPRAHLVLGMPGKGMEVGQSHASGSLKRTLLTVFCAQVRSPEETASKKQNLPQPNKIIVVIVRTSYQGLNFTSSQSLCFSVCIGQGSVQSYTW